MVLLPLRQELKIPNFYCVWRISFGTCESQGGVLWTSRLSWACQRKQLVLLETSKTAQHISHLLFADRKWAMSKGTTIGFVILITGVPYEEILRSFINPVPISTDQNHHVFNSNTRITRTIFIGEFHVNQNSDWFTSTKRTPLPRRPHVGPSHDDKDQDGANVRLGSTVREPSPSTTVGDHHKSSQVRVYIYI